MTRLAVLSDVHGNLLGKVGDKLFCHLVVHVGFQQGKSNFPKRLLEVFFRKLSLPL